MTRGSLREELWRSEGGDEFVGRSRFVLILHHYFPLSPAAGTLAVSQFDAVKIAVETGENATCCCAPGSDGLIICMSPACSNASHQTPSCLTIDDHDHAVP